MRAQTPAICTGIANPRASSQGRPLLPASGRPDLHVWRRRSMLRPPGNCHHATRSPERRHGLTPIPAQRRCNYILQGFQLSVNGFPSLLYVVYPCLCPVPLPAPLVGPVPHPRVPTPRPGRRPWSPLPPSWPLSSCPRPACRLARARGRAPAAAPPRGCRGRGGAGGSSLC